MGSSRAPRGSGRRGRLRRRPGNASYAGRAATTRASAASMPRRPVTIVESFIALTCSLVVLLQLGNLGSGDEARLERWSLGCKSVVTAREIRSRYAVTAADLLLHEV